MKEPKPMPEKSGSSTRLMEISEARQMEERMGYKIISEAEPLHTEDMMPPARMAMIWRLRSPLPVSLTMEFPIQPAKPVWNIPPPTIIMPTIRTIEVPA